ncbi:MAG: RdgB/HAM1 family non-canonical purine NTP pyrophosphatase [Bacteroidales bacterium]|nr:RdgB/HAM1 family non-canonical purine NTP pyrophosphatase [Bacteroidales bacterium]
MEIIIASNNKYKITEINAVLKGSVSLLSLDDAGINEDIPENENTLEGNALEKARYVHRRTGGKVFADDTGLEVEALDGAPGVHSARYAGDDKNSERNIDRLLDELKKHTNRQARFRTVIALIYDNEEHLFEGIVNGEIINERRGGEGFGYDPVFIPVNEKLTFAEMSAERKNKISHRAIATKKMAHFLLGRV